MKALQLFSEEALERGQQMSTVEIIRFLEDFRRNYWAAAAGKAERVIEQDAQQTSQKQR